MTQLPSERFVGVDLGGSGFRLYALRVLGRAPLAVEAAGPSFEGRWEESPDAPDAAARRVERLAAELCRLFVRTEVQGAPLVAAIAAPGTKTADGRGIEAALHVPRIPNLAGALEARVAGLRVALPLVGDGLAAARGEQVAPTGALVGVAPTGAPVGVAPTGAPVGAAPTGAPVGAAPKGALGGIAPDGAPKGVERGYYLGGGTGVSEAVVLDGVARALDALEPPLPRAFELTIDGADESFEQRLAPRRVVPGEDGARAFARDLGALVDARAAALGSFERVVLGQAYAWALGDEHRAALRARLGPVLVVSSLRAAPAIGALALSIDAGLTVGGAA